MRTDPAKFPPGHHLDHVATPPPGYTGAPAYRAGGDCDHLAPVAYRPEPWSSWRPKASGSSATGSAPRRSAAPREGTETVEVEGPVTRPLRCFGSALPSDRYRRPNWNTMVEPSLRVIV